MIKVLYDLVSDGFTNDELSFNGFASLALVTDKKDILSLIKNKVSKFDYSVCKRLCNGKFKISIQK